MTLSLAIVTPWLDHLDLAPAYWRAVGVRTGDVGVVIVDDGSARPVPEAAVTHERPLGFSRSCNDGADAANGAEALLFLNNDIALAADWWLHAIRAEVGPGRVVGPRMRMDAHATVDGRPQPWIEGWCLAITATDLAAIGGWDEGYEEPAYFGDNDLCARARAAGMKLVEVPCGLHHLDGVTRRDFDDVVPSVTGRNRGRYAARVRELGLA